MPQLILKPLGGLCNRMRAIDAALAMQKDYPMDLKIIWESSMELNCAFNQLFQPISSSTIHEVSVLNRSNFMRFNWRPLYNDIDIKHSKNFLTKFIRKNFGQEFNADKIIYANEVKQYFEEGFDFRSLTKHKRAYLATFYRFYTNKKPYQAFRPIPKLQAKIDAFLATFSSAPIGLHIRRTDHSKSIKESPIDLFEEKIKALIKDQENPTFLVCTDDDTIAKQLKAQFPQHIFFREKINTRHTPMGIQDALIDLYSLAKCQKIYGSYGSAFSNTAAYIGNIPIEILTKQKMENPYEDQPPFPTFSEA